MTLFVIEPDVIGVSSVVSVVFGVTGVSDVPGVSDDVIVVTGVCDVTGVTGATRVIDGDTDVIDCVAEGTEGMDELSKS